MVSDLSKWHRTPLDAMVSVTSGAIAAFVEAQYDVLGPELDASFAGYGGAVLAFVLKKALIDLPADRKSQRLLKEKEDQLSKVMDATLDRVIEEIRAHPQFDSMPEIARALNDLEQNRQLADGNGDLREVLEALRALRESLYISNGDESDN